MNGSYAAVRKIFRDGTELYLRQAFEAWPFRSLRCQCEGKLFGDVGRNRCENHRQGAKPEPKDSDLCRPIRRLESLVDQLTRYRGQRIDLIGCQLKHCEGIPYAMPVAELNRGQLNTKQSKTGMRYGNSFTRMRIGHAL